MAVSTIDPPTGATDYGEWPSSTGFYDWSTTTESSNSGESF